MSHRFFPIMILAIILQVSGICSGHYLLAQEKDWRERLLREAPEKWETYQSRASLLQGSITSTHIQTDPEQRKLDGSTYTVKQRPGSALIEMDTEERKTVDCMNPRYGFSLRWESSAESWLVAQIDTDLSDGANLSEPTPDTMVSEWTTCPLFFFGIPNAPHRPIINEPGFTLKRVSSTVQNETEFVKVEFDYRSSKDDPLTPSLRGWVLYDPANYWVTRQYDVEAQWDNSESDQVLKTSAMATFKYTTTDDGFPIPKRIDQEYTHLFKTPPAKFDMIFEFDLDEAEVPESEFTLSAFGFPEPGEVKRPTPWYLWLAIAGFVCLILAVFFRWRSRRVAASES